MLLVVLNNKGKQMKKKMNFWNLVNKKFKRTHSEHVHSIFFSDFFLFVCEFGKRNG